MEKELGHIMVDIETMGTKSYSVICSIAAVEFNLSTGETGRTFTTNIDISSCIDAGLRIDGSTIEWWLTQGDEARQNIITSTTDLYSGLIEFADFLHQFNLDDLEVWGNSARFDLGILENAFFVKNIGLPWKYSNERDVRTLVRFAPLIKKATSFKGVKHDALADCYHQISYCSSICQKLQLQINTQ